MASIDQSSEHLPHHDRSRHLGHRVEKRRKLHNVGKFIKDNAGKIAAVALATGIAIEANNLLKGEAPEPNAFYNGEIEIVMSDDLNVRTTPTVNRLDDGQPDNTVRWGDIDKVETKGGDWIVVKGAESFILYMPAVYKVDEPHPLDPWITFDAKVSGLFGEQEERLYINFSPKTEQFVKRHGPGKIYELGGNSGTDWTAKASVQK